MQPLVFALFHLFHGDKLPIQVFLHVRVQLDGNHLVAVQHFHRDGSGKVPFDDVIDDFQPLFHRHFLCGVVGECRQFLFFQVVLHIRRDGGGLNDQRLALRVYKYSVARQTLLPFLVGEIDGGR